MKIRALVGDRAKFDQDLAVFFVSEDHPLQDLKRLDSLTGGIASSLYAQGLLKTKHDQLFVAPTLGKMPSRLVAFVGLGKTIELTLEKVRVLGGSIITQAKAHKAATVAIDFDVLVSFASHPAKSEGFHLVQYKRDLSSDLRVGVEMTAGGTARALTEGLMLGNYEYKEFKSEPDDEQPVQMAEAIFILDDKMTEQTIAGAILLGEVEAQATIFARDLVNRPPARLHPKILKEEAEKIAAASGGAITVKVYGRDQLKEMGAGAILGVAQGSEFEPFLVHLEYHPTSVISAPTPRRSEQSDQNLATERQQSNRIKSVALVGKGVTFDSGGLSIKTSEGMEDMKMDMAGAATVLGVFSHLVQWKPGVHVHGIFPTVENMLSDRALRTGDVLTSMSGQTIEVLNTDAEGRLILADALYYAEQQKPDAMIDFATLTGSCLVALGQQVAGLFTKDDNLAQTLSDVAKETGEKLCRLPLVEEYDEELKSEVADMQNISKGKYGGAITGALFLQRFVKNTPWGHFDIAGPAFCRTAFNSYTPVGGTGFGVRTILHWLKTF